MINFADVQYPGEPADRSDEGYSSYSRSSYVNEALCDCWLNIIVEALQ